jgi:hypothetical protein
MDTGIGGYLVHDGQDSTWELPISLFASSVEAPLLA